MNIFLRSTLFLALLLPFGCSGDDDPVIPPPPRNCTITSSGLDYGQVLLGQTLDMSFAITNSGTDTLRGSVSELCPDFSIQSGDGAYALAPTESRMVTVTFAPTVTGTRNCIVGTGNSECGNVALTGEGVVLSKTLVSSLDNTLYEDAAGGISNGIGQWMFVGVTKGTPSPGGNTDPPEIRRAVFKFDIASAGIPAGSTIDNVFLTLYLSNPPIGLNGPQWQNLHRLTKSWGEGPSMPLNPNEGAGAPADTNDATWLHRFFPATLWTQPGGDSSSTKSSNLRVGDVNGPKTWGSTANMVSDVQLWFSTPASNHGWILIAEDECTPQTAKRFATRQRSVTSERPTLVIYYSEP